MPVPPLLPIDHAIGDLITPEMIEDLELAANTVVSLRGAANGYATLDGAGLVPLLQLPSLAQAQITGLTAALALKAPLASPVFTGSIVTPFLGTLATTLQIGGGSGGLLIRDAAFANTNLSITDAGAVTVRAGLTVSAGQIKAPDGTAGAPSYNFSNSVNTGLFYGGGGSGAIILSSAATPLLFAQAGGVGIRLASTTPLAWASGAADSTASDTILQRDAANTLGLRNGTTAQKVSIYGTYFDASNYERLSLITSAGTQYIRTENLGTGVARNLSLDATGAVSILLRTNGANRWVIDSTGLLYAGTDNTQDIGTAVGNRPRNIYQHGTTHQIYNPGAGIANDGTNYERVNLAWNTNQTLLVTEAGGTGVVRDMVVGTNGNASLYLRVSSINVWRILSSGHFLAQTDNSYDIGASGANRPRNLYVAGFAACAVMYPGSGGVRSGTGVLSNATGNDGDLYFRTDGGALTTIYQRRAGVYVGIV